VAVIEDGQAGFGKRGLDKSYGNTPLHFYYRSDIMALSPRLTLTPPAANRGGLTGSQEMKRLSITQTVSVLAASLLLNIGAAHAAPGPCFLMIPMPGGAPACASAQAKPPVAQLVAPRGAPGAQPACPTNGAGEPGQSACDLSNRELGQALGNMAAGGMQIAATVMRTLAGEASRLLLAEPDM
jgi:hypothetical protein